MLIGMQMNRALEIARILADGDDGRSWHPE